MKPDTDSSHLAAPSSSRTSGDAAPNAPSAYAPGPWIIDREFKQVHVIAGRSAVARVMHGRDDGEANARLIAAAPELLGALQNWLGSPDDPKAGWQGSGGSHEFYACPYCNAKHGDCTQIPHSARCPIPPARAAITKALGTPTA